VREQLEHDRIIRLLQAKYKRKFDVAINPGHVQAAPVGAGPSPWYPDLVLSSNERSKKLLGVVEVETVESVNNLEAMSQWATFSRLRAEFHLYVPAICVDSVKRLITDLQLTVGELWAYNTIGDQIRFTLMQRSPQAAKAAAAAAARAAAPKPAAVKPLAPAKLAAPAKPAAIKPAASKPAPKPAPKAVKPAEPEKRRPAAAVRAVPKPPAKVVPVARKGSSAGSVKAKPSPAAKNPVRKPQPAASKASASKRR
jgi:hypothetical protein